MGNTYAIDNIAAGGVFDDTYAPFKPYASPVALSRFKLYASGFAPLPLDRVAPLDQ